MITRNKGSLEMVLKGGGRTVVLRPGMPIFMDGFAGAKVRLFALPDCRLIACQLLVPESRRMIKVVFDQLRPKSYALKSGKEAVSLETFIYGLRTELNGKL